MDLVRIPGGSFELGWRFTLPSDLRANAELAETIDFQISRCSPARTVELAAFAFRLGDADIEDCFCETLEECFVRPVRA